MTDGTTTSAVDYALRRQQRALERRSERRRKLPLVIAVVMLGVMILTVLVEVAVSVGRVHPGVTVGGIAVGGMTPAQASVALEKALPSLVDKPVTVVFEDKDWSIDASDVGLSFDIDGHVKSAMAVGRSGGVAGIVTDRLSAWFTGVDVEARPSDQAARMEDVLARIAKGIDQPAVDAKVVIDGTKLAVEPSRDGRALVRDRARRMILSAMVSDSRQVKAPVETVAPGVSNDEAEAASKVASAMLSDSVLVTFGDREWRFSPEQIATWLEFRRSDRLSAAVDSAGADPSISSSGPAEVTLVPFISAEKLRRSVVPALGAKVGRPARSARFTTANGRVSIIPSQEGIGPDLDALAADLTVRLKDASARRAVELRTTKAEPELTTAEAEAMGVKERISRFTTTYDPGNESRVNNIHLLGDALDGKLIPPGGTFSFNGTVGERTAAKGYQEANAIVNGKLVPQLGGGICQVGTTLFNAVFESGLPVVERRNHSFYISHYPDGRDATVSWGGPDLKFKNDTEHWVLISVSYTSSSITIALYGTDPGYDVKAEKGPWTDFRDYPIEEVKDPTMPKGKRIVEDKGIRGRRIVVTRTVYRNGEVVRTDRFVSVYKPKVEVVRVGTRPVAQSSEPTPTARP